MTTYQMHLANYDNIALLAAMNTDNQYMSLILL